MIVALPSDLPAVGAVLHYHEDFYTVVGHETGHDGRPMARVEPMGGWGIRYIHRGMTGYQVLPLFPSEKLSEIVGEPVDCGDYDGVHFEIAALFHVDHSKGKTYCGGLVEKVLIVKVSGGLLRRWYVSREDYGPKAGALRLAIPA